jgi:hypothetical protein
MIFQNQTTTKELRNLEKDNSFQKVFAGERDPDDPGCP